ncbi:MAG: sulfite exporter TauE/SafE family protein [Candidatus Competibacteraceae bacterium]
MVVVLFCATPLLVYGLGVPVHEAVVVSLAAVGTTTLSGVGWCGCAMAMAELRTAVIFGLSGIIGAPLGAWLYLRLPETILLASFCAVDAGSGVRLWQQASRRPEEIPHHLRGYPQTMRLLDWLAA